MLIDNTRRIINNTIMATNTTVPEVLIKYFEGILYDAKLLTNDTVTNELLEEELYRMFKEFVNEKMIEAVPDSNLAEFESLVTRNVSQEELDTFLQKVIPNIQDVYDAVLVNFRDIYLGLGKYADATNLPNVVKVV